jgi:ABC-type transport system substrate-binding protein
MASRPGIRWFAAALLQAAFVAAPIPVDAAPTAGSPKVLYVAQQSIGGDALDPAQISSVIAASILENMMEPMLRYDYLARPLKLVPNTLAAMPEVGGGGRVYICRLQRGVLFAPDPAFHGKPRELTAADYAYGIRRLFDPRYRSSQFFLVDGKIAGANALRKAALNGGRFDYDKPITGLQALDRYTLRIELTRPDLNFAHVLAQQVLAAVAREAVERYGDDIGTHPLGTGPFYLLPQGEGSKLVLAANPNFRHEVFSGDPGDDAEAQAIAARMKGRKLPMVDRVEVIYTTEDQPMWLAFLAGDLDLLPNLPVAFRPMAVPNGRLAPHLAKQGVALHNYIYPAVWFGAFNLRDPVVGGYTPERVALRRAISLAFDRNAAIGIIFNGGGLAADSVVPPGIAGHDPRFATDVFRHDLPRAKALLDQFGYVDRDGDGWREAPDGSPLTIAFGSLTQPRFRPWEELWSKTFGLLGLRMELQKMHQAELTKLMMAAKHQLAMSAWNMDFPDGEDFYVILHGGAAGTANSSHFALPAFDRLYDESRLLVDSPERNALYRRMDKLAAAYMPMVMHLYPVRAALTHPWLTGYKPHPAHLEAWKYLDIDLAARNSAGGRN